jgi:hypothetical protein
MADGHASDLFPRQRGSGRVHTGALSEEAIRKELSRVFASHEFRSSKRSQEFLTYVVENTLTGRAGTLKERTIGVDVFGRSNDYDPSDDATVRVKAGEVRKRLGLYYATQGAGDSIRIELPAGTYVPEFRTSEHETTHEHPAVSTEVLPPPELARTASEPARKRKTVVPIALAAVALAVAGYVWLRPQATPSAVDQFWSPVLQGTTPVALCAAYVPVYSPNNNPSSKPARLEDFVRLTDQYVGGGDLMAVSRLSAMLTRMQRPYQVKIGDAVSFHDLRTAPAVLVGYSYTRWKDISTAMRYSIEDLPERPIGITDGGVLTKWTLPNLPADRRTTEDYAIVSRVFHPDTHAMLVEIAGITQYGTEAAAELVTKSDLLAEALKSAPTGWREKNLQLVLHVKVISGSPSSPKIVATYFW